MDMTQLAQMVTWLQEEQQQDRLEIERLTQRLDVLKKDNIEQATKTKDLEGQLGKQGANLTQSTLVEASLERVKREVALMLERHKTDLQQAEKDAAVLRQTERKSVNKAVEDIRGKVQQVSQLDSLHSIPFLEDLTRRNERNIQQLQTLDAELRHQQNLSAEALQLAEVERDRQMTQWRTEMHAQQQMIEQYTSRIASLQEQSQAGNQLLQTLSQFEERLQKQQDQVAELQRLAEDRQKRELGEWQAENEKRWKQWETASERQLADYRMQSQEILERLDRIESRLAELTSQLKTLWQAQRSFAYHRVGEVQRWVADFEKLWGEYEESETGDTKPGAQVTDRHGNQKN